MQHQYKRDLHTHICWTLNWTIMLSDPGGLNKHIEDVYMLVGIAPRDIRRSVWAWMERAKRMVVCQSINALNQLTVSYHLYNRLASLQKTRGDVVVVLVCHDQLRRQVSQGFRCRDSKTYELIPPDTVIDSLVTSQLDVWCKRTYGLHLGSPNILCL